MTLRRTRRNGVFLLALSTAASSACTAHDTSPDAGIDASNPYLASHAIDPDPDVAWPALPDTGGSADVVTGTCTDPDLDVLDYWLYRGNNLMLYRYDFRALGLTDNTPFSINILRADPYTPMPMQTAEGCTYFTVGRSGNTARNIAPSLNFGDITFSASGQSIRYYYDTSTHQYLLDVSMLTGQIPTGVPYSIHFAGGPDGNALDTTEAMPPLITTDMIHWPSQLSRSTDSANVVTWDLPPGTQPHTVMFFFGVNDTRDQLIACAVPACRRQVVIPAALLTNYATGETFGATLVLLNTMHVTSGMQDVKIQLGVATLTVFAAP